MYACKELLCILSEIYDKVSNKSGMNRNGWWPRKDLLPLYPGNYIHEARKSRDEKTRMAKIHCSVVGETLHLEQNYNKTSTIRQV